MISPSLLWAVIQQGSRQLSGYVVFLVLSVLVQPRDFGVLGLGMSWVAFGSLMSETGISGALIQRTAVERGHLSTAFFVNVAAGLLLCGTGMALAGPIAGFFDTPDVRPVIKALSMLFLLNGVAATHVSVMQREMKFRDLALRDTIAAVGGGLIGIVAALVGLGVWSLVLQVLVTSLVSAVLIWAMCRWRPGLGEVSLERLKDLWGYSAWLWWFNILKFFAQQGDRLLVAYLLGPIALGLYNFAYKVVLYPGSSLAGAVGTYLFPRLSRIQDQPKEVRGEYVLVQRLLMSVIAPAMVLLAVWAPDLIPAVFGDKWRPAVALIQILAAVGVAQAVISPAGQLMKALNRPEWLFKWSMAFTAVVVVCVGIGTRWSITGVGAGLAVAHLFGMVATLAIIEQLTGLRWERVVGACGPVIAAAVLAGAVLWFITVSEGRLTWFIGGAAALASLVAYGAVLSMFDRELVQSIVRRREAGS